MLSSDDLLELAQLPESMVFIGGGVISLELGQVFRRAGVKVTVLEAMPQLLPRMEPEVVGALAEQSRKLGMEIQTGVGIESIVKHEKGFKVTYGLNGEVHSVVAGLVANGAGRVAKLDGLDLAAADIEIDSRGGVVVDQHLRSASQQHIFVAGDSLTTSAQLSPIAGYEGAIVGHNLNAADLRSPEYQYIPSAVYTVPALATVGMTEEQAKVAGLTFDVKLNDMTSWRSSRSYAETVAYSKFIIEKDNGKILGAHIIGHGAQEIINYIALAMKTGQTADQLKGFVCAYPTFTADIKFML